MCSKHLVNTLSFQVCFSFCLVFISGRSSLHAQTVTVVGDSVTPTTGMISVIWTRSWRVNELMLTRLEARGGTGQFAWSVGGSTPTGYTVSTSGNRRERATITLAFRPPGTYPISITVTESSTQQSVTFGPFDVVVGASLNTVFPFRSGATVGYPYNALFTVAAGTPQAECLTVNPPVLDCTQIVSSSGATFVLNGTFTSVDRLILDIRIPTDIGPAFTKIALTVKPPSELSTQLPSTRHQYEFYQSYVNIRSETGTAPYSFRITSGTIPTGTHIRGNGEGVVVEGELLTAGTYEYTLTATDVWGATGSITTQYSVLPVTPFEIRAVTPARGRVGQSYALGIPWQGNAFFPEWSISAGSLPPGLVLNTSKGVIGGFPAQAGSYNFTVTAKALAPSSATASMAVKIDIDPGPGPVIATPGVLPVAFVGKAYTITLSALGGTPPYRWSNDTALPPGLTLSSTGVISGTPTAIGPDRIYVSVVDALGSKNTVMFELFNVMSESPIVLRTAEVGQLYDSGYLGDYVPLSVDDVRVLGELPPGVYLHLFSGYLSGTPQKAGEYQFALEVGQRGSGAVRSFFLKVNPSPGVAGYSVPEQGSRVFVSGAAGTELRVSYASIQPERVLGTVSDYQVTPSGAAFIQYRSGGILISETTVPAVEVVSAGKIFAEITDVVNTGLAFVSPASQTITLRYKDTGGTVVRTVSFPIQRGGQISAFLDQPPYNAPSPFVGTVSFSAQFSFSVLALRGRTNERGEFLLTTLPIINDVKTGPTVIPQFAAGGGWTTQLVLVSPVFETQRGTIEFLSPGSETSSPERIPVLVNGELYTVFSYAVPGDGVQQLTITLPEDAVRIGSVRITPIGTTTPSGILAYSFRPGGVTLSETGFAFAPIGYGFRFFAENAQNPRVQTGLAIANAASSTITVELKLLTLEGKEVGRAPLTLPAYGQIARYLHEIPALHIPSEFEGMVVVSATSSNIAVSGIRGHYNQRGDYFETSIVASDVTGAVSPAEKIFPHLVNGEGYTTKVVLFSGAPAQNGQGYMRVFSPSGVPADVFTSSQPSP